MNLFRKKHPFFKKIAFLFSFILLFCYLTGFTMPVVNAAASGKPGTPILGHDNFDNDGNYTITMNMWWGNNGTSWTLYENDIQVYTGALTDGSPNAQTVSKSFTDKAAGTYTYVCYLNNSYGSVSSAPISVNVNTGGGIVNSGIKIAGADTASEALQLTVSQGTTEFSLSATGVTSPNYNLSTSNSSVADFQILNGNTLKINGLKAGRTSLKIKETTTNKVRYVGIRVKTSGGSLPGLPDYLSIGSVSEDSAADLDFWKDYGTGLTNKRMDIRYIYLNGGPENGWKTWGDGNGGRAVSFIRESKKLGMIPFFVYYNIPDGSESYELDKQHIESDSYMQSYFKDLKFALDIIKQEGGDETVGLILEPDFLGYMMQNSGKQPDQITARTSAVYSAGILSTSADPVFPDTLTGLVKAINYTINKYAPNAYFGWQFNLWASPGITTGIPSTGLMRITDTQGVTNGRQALVSEAKEIYKYYGKAGVSSYGADFVSIDKYGLDAGISSPSNPSASTWFWNLDHWNNYLLFNKTLHQESGLPVILWQIPVGHINQSTSANPYNQGTFPDLDNTNQHYEDSAPTFFLGDTFTASGTRFNYFSTNQGNDPKLSVSGSQITWNSHAREAADAGIISVLFGAGVGNSTDGVGSPPTDSYWWITKAQSYFNNPEPLGGGNPIETVAAPAFTPAGGTYTTAQSVTISCSTDGATIRYTTDGSTPSNTSSVYAGPISVTSTKTIKARAFKSGMADSPLAESTYTIGTVSQVAAPVFTPGGGTYQSSQNVTISCATSGATIRYTTDGTTPTTSSPVYTGAINISASQTVKAYASKSGMTDSTVTTAVYTVNSSYPAWATYIPYALGDLVTYNGITYKCTLAHTSLPGWEPPLVPVLWQAQ